MKKEWTPAFEQMTYGIYVLTTASQGRINGMIASWVTQVSHDPPLVMAAVHPNRYSHSLLEDCPYFGLHVLSRSQAPLLKTFKGPDPAQKFDGIDWETKKTGVPVLKDCLAWFELETQTTLAPGTHTLFIGQVVNAGGSGPGPNMGADIKSTDKPLSTLDYEGCYRGDK